ncbi:MAG: hypothetical protein V1751_06315 [Pseudomonadota bacterium]
MNVQHECHLFENMESGFKKGSSREVTGMHELTITIQWSGPYTVKRIIKEMTKGGRYPDYDGDDYGLYQIYGTHILCGEDTLIYVGKAINQRFSTRFKQHSGAWLADEEDVQIYLGRIYDPKRHSAKDNWGLWKKDAELAEKIMIYKYSPPYNSSSINKAPSLKPYRNVRLVHKGKRYKLKQKDNAPKEW